MKTFRFALALLAAPACAQTPASPPAPLSAPQTDYIVVRLTADVAASADKVWAKIGDYCFLGQLLSVTCDYVPGTGTGGMGTIRRLNGVTFEPQIARTPYSYTYSQIEGARKGMDYHGTMGVEPIDRTHSRIVYALIIDLSKLPPNVDKATIKPALVTRFQGVIDKAKTLVEADR